MQILAPREFNNIYSSLHWSQLIGLPSFTAAAAKLAFADAGNIIADGRNVTTQGISGTGALRIGSAFLAKFSGGRPVYLPRVSALYSLRFLTAI